MAGGDLRAGQPEPDAGKGLRVGIVRARWNSHLVDRLVEGARRGLTGTGVLEADIVEVAVPGSFEIPFGARVLATSGRVDALVCVGAVVRGETTHYDIVAGECAAGIQQVQLRTGVPIGFGVLTVENEDQALARSEGPGGHNVGEEAAWVAVEMARLATVYAS
ncbi:MAG TPA: 6,7-dimethyl-8-ribityllumazine synthase [Acidimicrobiales bacterium]